MADHALVVGCDSYPHVPGGDLTGAVGDAVAMYSWLIGPAGVPAANVTLLLSGGSAGGAAPDGPAARSDFAGEIANLIELTDVDRLYVYFAGHGCRSDPQNQALATDVLAFTDFVPRDPSSGVAGVEELLRKLRLSHFKEVVVVLDACRDFPFGKAFQVGGIAFDPDGAGGGRTPDLYLLQATQPGRQVSAGLTGALLDGLAGGGVAKQYVEGRGAPYLVRWSSLVAYVVEALPGQDPHDEGAARDVVLASFPENHFPPVRLTVDVDPSASAASSALSVEVTYWDPASRSGGRLSGSGPAPLSFSVPPRRQVVTATHDAAWARVPVEVYADDQVTVFLGGPGRTPLGEPVDPTRGRPADAGAVRITAGDPLAAIEVRTLAGRPVGAGLSPLARDLGADQYLVLATDAYGREHWEPLDVVADYQTDLHLVLPRPPAVAPPEIGISDGFGCVVEGDPMYFPEASARFPDGLSEPIPGRGPYVLDPSARQLDLHFGQHRLEITAIPGLTARVVFDGPRLWVSYFDTALVDDESAFSILERAQRLRAAGRDRAAQIVLGRRLLPRSLVASRLAEPQDGEPYRLRGVPWGVYLDRPEGGSQPSLLARQNSRW